MSLHDLAIRETEALRPILRSESPALVADLASLIRIPSVSWPGFDQASVEASAAAVAELFRKTNLFESVQVLRTTGAPAVVARRPARNGAPTVVLYAHHDVQPTGEDDLWESPPYEPTVRRGRLYGRGSADDKAGIVVHLGAVRALTQLYGDNLDLGIVVFVEGEEENGSPSFSTFLDAYQEELSGDIIIVADSDNPSSWEPAITVSLRGNVTAVLTIETLDHAVHSGMFGGAVPDALMAFVQVASSFYHPDGSLAISGLEGLSSGNQNESLRIGDEAGLLEGVREIGQGSVPDRLWRSAALTITGVDAPSVKNASNTLVPRVSAKLSLRVPPGMSAAQAKGALEKHLERMVPLGAHWRLSEVSMGEPFLVDESAEALSLAAQALEASFGHAPRFQGVGGSIPFIAQLAERFPDADILVTGVEDPDTRAHSPNESLDLRVLWRAALAESVFLSLLNRRSSTASVDDSVLE